MAFTIVLKHFLHGGGVAKKKESYPRLPDFCQLHDLGEELLSDSGLTVQEFDLIFENTVLRNDNVRDQLHKLKLHGTDSALLFLKLRGLNPCSVSREKFLICIEGNIGSRKSDLMQKLVEINEHKPEQLKVIREPVIKDLQEGLAQFGEALRAGEHVSDLQKQASSDFEKKMFQHHFRVATEERKMHVVSERSLEAKIHVFNALSCEQGRLIKSYRDDMQKEYNDKIKGHRQHQPHVVIFFEIPVSEAMDRIRKRGRKSEEHITLNYLREIERMYEALYPPGAPNVIRVKSDQPMEDVINGLLEEIRNVLSKVPTASPAAIDDFLKFFRDERPEPSQ
ncbi:unnamed protein product [Symbiodinium sp. CCMP2456]|nr:unnamed protein product [Symbiodinium sp. CCMP2456]